MNKTTDVSTLGAVVALRTLTCRAMYERQPMITEDGGTVALDWFQPRGYAKLPTDTPVVLILHGLTGEPFEHKIGQAASQMS